MMKRVFVALLGLVVMPAMAADSEAIQQLKGDLVKVFGAVPDAVNEAPVKGLYEVTYGPKLYYVTLDGRYLFSGELFDLKTRTNLTEENRSKVRLKTLSSVDKSSMITYKAKGKEKYHITVFTDIDCGYCRKLHSGMKEMNELGITVSYLAYPRAGIGSSSYDKAVNVWCADDRHKAMDEAKRGANPAKASCDAPVKQHYELGVQVGVTGTPAIVLSDGTLMPGYLPPKQLLKALEQNSK